MSTLNNSGVGSPQPDLALSSEQWRSGSPDWGPLHGPYVYTWQAVTETPFHLAVPRLSIRSFPFSDAMKTHGPVETESDNPTS
ncbi:hypothetical protein HYFRA_00007552 [Hymenoscyphus fraxineus]|uniref:Uncharacterized protein n=1 Tax=Hymenoscyphus fraxineus TaxID=746836 RepID=A0A9N9KST5_9HELO|nr:hypothetical protein HYFRA_00007552 [Hymenoscyphus fraxineus]